MSAWGITDLEGMSPSEARAWKRRQQRATRSKLRAAIGLAVDEYILERGIPVDWRSKRSTRFSVGLRASLADLRALGFVQSARNIANARDRAYYAENRELMQGRLRDKRKRQDLMRRWGELRRKREQQARWARENPETVAESQRKWRAKNGERCREYDRARYAANPEKKRAARRAYHAANRERINAARREKNLQRGVAGAEACP